ncbi:nuclear factor interleukin-3-regulated protein-like [Chelonus insularis]|uniref:nuclear factor interleukin-3-regulated protein-like n=1 Tax=Chelonus insularis TaxID=460826 RepID=UPI00158DBD88|nr:nuclear factor interleukin-3-regulated protein-like [Chelonus insularis]
MNSLSRSRHHRSEKKPIPEDKKDAKYYERRKRNNQAAKKSRDARRMREDIIALKAQFLENENVFLWKKVVLLSQELEKLVAFVQEIQRNIPDLRSNHSLWFSNYLQTTYIPEQTSCCMKNIHGTITEYPTSVESTTTSVTALTTFISRLSSQLPTLSTL